MQLFPVPLSFFLVLFMGIVVFCCVALNGFAVMSSQKWHFWSQAWEKRSVSVKLLTSMIKTFSHPYHEFCNLKLNAER